MLIAVTASSVLLHHRLDGASLHAVTHTATTLAALLRPTTAARGRVLAPQLQPCLQSVADTKASDISSSRGACVAALSVQQQQRRPQQQQRRGGGGGPSNMLRPADALRAVVVCAATLTAYAWVLVRRLVLRRSHPLGWPLDLDVVAAGFRASVRCGNLTTLRLFLGALARPLHSGGLRITRVQPPGCDDPAFWLDLASSSGPTLPPPPDAVVVYVHGGAFVAGSPLMCGATFARWLRELRQAGVRARVLAVSYPLAPERPFPAAVAAVAAAIAWALQQYSDAAQTSVFVLGDSAGGNISVAALAALRDVNSTTSTTGSATTSSSNLTAALEAQLFSDLRARLAVMAAAGSAAAHTPNQHDAPAGSAAAAAGSIVPVPPRMPSGVVLVSPATDISPGACFRRPSASSEPHYDYLPRGLEARGMGSYAPDHHEALAGPYASPVYLASVAGLTAGRWLVLSGGVEILSADIHRFVAKLRRDHHDQSLAEEDAVVVHHEQRHLPHSWAIIPAPGLAELQRVVPEFLAAECRRRRA